MHLNIEIVCTSKQMYKSTTQAMYVDVEQNYFSKRSNMTTYCPMMHGVPESFGPSVFMSRRLFDQPSTKHPSEVTACVVDALCPHAYMICLRVNTIVCAHGFCHLQAQLSACIGSVSLRP